jgi:hypothetical protein
MCKESDVMDSQIHSEPIFVAVEWNSSGCRCLQLFTKVYDVVELYGFTPRVLYHSIDSLSYYLGIRSVA